jgi:hypothetical protein
MVSRTCDSQFPLTVNVAEEKDKEQNWYIFAKANTLHDSNWLGRCFGNKLKPEIQEGKR